MGNTNNPNLTPTYKLNPKHLNQLNTLSQSNLNDYRWFISLNTTSWDIITNTNTTNTISWCVFPLELSQSIEIAYQQQTPFEYDNNIIIFDYTAEQHHIQINATDAWLGQRLIKRALPSTMNSVYRSNCNCFAIAITKIDDEVYQYKLMQNVMHCCFGEILYMISPDITYDKESEVMSKFMNCYVLIEKEFWKDVEMGYVQYLRKELGIASMKVVTFDLLCKLIKKEFVKKRKVYYKCYFEDINEEMFLQQVLKAFIEEGTLYKDIISLYTNTFITEDNIDLVSYYLCLLLSLTKLSEQAFTEFYTYIPLSTSLTFEDGKYYHIKHLTFTSKNKFNNAPLQTGYQYAQILIPKMHKDSLAFNLPYYDISNHSIYNDELVVLPQHTILQYKGIIPSNNNNNRCTSLLFSFELVQDYINTAIPYMITPWRKNHGVYEDIMNISDKECMRVLYAKLKAKNINDVYQIKQVRKLDCFGNDIKTEGLSKLSRQFRTLPNLISLTINGSNINLEGFKAFNEHIHELPLLKVLDLSYNALRDCDVCQVQFGLLKQLQFIVLKENNITYKGAEHLSRELKECKYLRCIDLYSNNIGNKGLIALCDVFRDLKYIEELNFWECKITNEGFDEFVKVIRNGSLNVLERVVFKYNEINSNNNNNVVDGFVNAIERLEKIKEIDLSQTKLNDNDFMRIYNVLYKRNCKWKVIEGLFTLSSSSTSEDNNSNNNNKHKLKLKCGNVNILKSKLKLYSHYTSFDLSECELNNESLLLFLNTTPHLHQLTSLDISFNSFTPNILQHLRSPSINLHNLHHLNISSNNISDNGMYHLSQAFDKTPNITKLILCWNNITDKGLTFFTKKLQHIPKLKVIDLYGNNITDKSFIPFIATLKDHIRKLRVLNMGKNHIGNMGIKTFKVCLRHMIYLTDVNFSYNAFDDKGVFALTNEIQCILDLLTFDISGNNITNDLKKVLYDQGFPYKFQI